MKDQALCPWCASVAESIHHVFFECPAVYDLWAECDCSELAVGDPAGDFKDILAVWKKNHPKKCALGVTLLWKIWHRRNEKIFKGREVPHTIVRERVRRLSEDCGKYATRVYGSVSGSKCNSPKKWIPPPDDTVKINCDACLKTEGWIGLGAVARNNAGEVLAVGVRRVRGLWSPEIAECRALLFGIQLAIKFGHKKVILESDCQYIISRLSNASTYLSDLDLVLDEIFSLCSRFDFVHWSHVRRDGNFVAHHLASLVPVGVDQTWENFCPPEISPYVLSDKLSMD